MEIAMESDSPVQLPVAEEIQAQAPTSQPVPPGQTVYAESTPGQEEQPQAGRGLELTIDTDFLKSPLCYIKIAEFVVLLGAWISIVKFFHDNFYEEEANFFRFITIFCWVMVILYLIIYTFSVPKLCKWRRPSMFTLMSLIFYFIMFGLLLACTGNLVYLAAFWGNWLQKNAQRFSEKENTYRSLVVSLGVASAFGFLSCTVFVVDMVLSYKVFQTQRAQETSPDQGPPQRRAWDINKNYLRSSVIYVKLAEIALLFAAWVCIVKYFADMYFELPSWARSKGLPIDSKAEFFKGVTILSWVIAILLALTSALSFDKLCSRSSPWALKTMIINLILSILLFGSSGNLIAWAILKKTFTALYIGSGFGFLSCVVFVLDIKLSYKFFQTQRAQETSPDQGPTQRQAGDVNKNYLQSPVYYVKLAEIALLFVAWVCILIWLYFLLFDRELAFKGSKERLFRGITIFSWAMVIFLALTSKYSFDKLCRRSSSWTLMTIIIYFTLFILLIACCGNLTPRAVVWGTSGLSDEGQQPYARLAVLIALVFGLLCCMMFVVDMVLSYKLYQTQRAQETSPDEVYPQRRAGDVNAKYLLSPVFFVKLAEFVFLFVAWVCIVNYFDLFLFEHMWDDRAPDKDLKADLFQGIAVFCWVMVNVLAFTFALSLDKLCNRSSRWTLTTIIIYFILSILLIASCGNLTPRAVDYGKLYKNTHKTNKPHTLALIIGLAFGYISWVVFIVDITLLYKLYRQQRAEELLPQQQAGQPGIVQQAAAVVIVPQGAKQQVYQPVAHPGQPPVQYPGQQPVMAGVPPPSYS
ncbi:uncharacterized protein LOC144649952 isoform X1 [Oculina patagonica]